MRWDQVAQGFIQSGLENLQGQRPDSLCEQPVPLLASPHGEERSLGSSGPRCRAEPRDTAPVSWHCSPSEAPRGGEKQRQNPLPLMHVILAVTR